MVKADVLRWALLPTMVALISGTAIADGVLEQMQNEVTDIATRTRSAVVTIEDARAAVAFYDGSPLKRDELTTSIDLLNRDKQTLDKRVSALLLLYSTGATDRLTLDEAKSRREQVDLELTAKTDRLNRLGNVSPQQVALSDFQDRISLLTIEKRLLNERLETFERLMKAGSATAATVAEAKRNRDVAEQKLMALGRQLDLMKNSGATANVVAYYLQDAPPKSGTGFSIGGGYIVTTEDVLSNMKSPVVVTDAGLKIRVTIVGMDKDLNVGLVKLTNDVNIPALALGDSGSAVPGHFAITVGNQSGQNNAVALNMISALRNKGTDTGGHFYPRLIEIGGTVGAGASGAPLMDAKGTVIGVLVGVPVSAPVTTSYTLGGLLNTRIAPASTYNLSGTRYALPATTPRPNNANNASQGKDSRVDPHAQSGTAADPAAPILGPETYQQDASDLYADPGQSSDAASLKPTGQAGRREAANENDVFDATTFSFPQWDQGGVQWNRGASRSAAVTSAGFAIPIDEIKGIIEELKAGTRNVRGWIGIVTDDEEHDSETAGIIHIDRTVKITGVVPDSPAARAGLAPGDVLLALDDHALETTDDVREISLHLRVGNRLEARIRRAGKEMRLSLQIDARPASPRPPVTAPIR